jgi:hypothetical protein
MPTDQEMQRGLEFSKGRAAAYQAIADKGGEGRMSADAAAAEATRFQGFADAIAQRIAERTS